MRGFGLALTMAVALSGCSEFNLFASSGGSGGEARPSRPAPTSEPVPQARPTASGSGGTTVVAPPRAVTSTVGALDRVSEAEKADARNAAANASTTALGTVTVSLGDPGDPGLWVKTGLVQEEVPGTVTTAEGESVAIALRPLAGAGGAQISLSALQALGLPLAGLHRVTLARN